MGLYSTKHGKYFCGSQADADIWEAAQDDIQRVKAIKVTAGTIINTHIPEWMQRNMLARKSELQDKRIIGEALTPDEQVEWDDMAAKWEWVKSVRATSDAAEANNTQPENITWP